MVLWTNTRYMKEDIEVRASNVSDQSDTYSQTANVSELMYEGENMRLTQAVRFHGICHPILDLWEQDHMLLSMCPTPLCAFDLYPSLSPQFISILGHIYLLILSH